jgi:hypothetical protein
MEKFNITDQVAATVTDTPSVMKKAWVLMSKKHPKNLMMGCWAHVGALAMADIGGQEPFKTVRFRLGRF